MFAENKVNYSCFFYNRQKIIVILKPVGWN